MNFEPQVFLPASVIEQTTGRKKYKAQTRVMRQMGFTVLQHPEGKPLVTWANFESVTKSHDRDSAGNIVVLNEELL